MNEPFASVWDALKDTPEEAENMKLRSELMIALKLHIERSGLSQAKAAKIFRVTQPRLSDLLRGKISAFSIDSLVNLAVRGGFKIPERKHRQLWGC